MFTNNKALTLIELLVVVLIIGILAAIAVPKYQLAVDKTHLANLQAQVKSIKSAFENYYLATGQYPNSFDKIDIGFSSSFQKKTLGSREFYIFPDSYCGIGPGGVGSGTGPIVYCGMNDYSFAYHYDYDEKQYICVAANENDRAQRVCKSLKNRQGPSGYDLLTTTGYKNNNGKKYTYYFLE